mmetsp:Transcript_18163/g.39106  ORF Transcript_18163/g.39106 Transcript_18163/m.39106 type:complete len:92 (-) Transcript_18163:1136-1411(-)
MTTRVKVMVQAQTWLYKKLFTMLMMPYGKVTTLITARVHSSSQLVHLHGLDVIRAPVQLCTPLDFPCLHLCVDTAQLLCSPSMFAFCESTW